MGRENSTTIGRHFWPITLLCLFSLVLVVAMVHVTRPAAAPASSLVLATERTSPAQPAALQASPGESARTIHEPLDSPTEAILPFDIRPYQEVSSEFPDDMHEQDSLASIERLMSGDEGQRDAGSSQTIDVALLDELAGIAAAAAREEAWVASEEDVAGTVLFMTSADYNLSEGEPTARELDMRAAQVSYEADRRLDLLADMYQLSDEQQALVYPILARASQAYHPAIPIENEEWTDAILATSARAPVSASYWDNPVKQAALDSSLESVEQQVALLLDDKQLAAMGGEQADRYEWWTEILSQISSDLEAEEAVAQGLPASSQPEAGSGAGAESNANSGGAPTAHQGGNLFNLLNSGP